MEFIQQRMQRDVIEVSPLKNRLEAATESKSYVIEPVRLDASGKPISESRIVSVEDFAKALEGFAEVGADGTVKPTGCFAAGTLVHTADGSQPEDGGERALRRVINKFAHLDSP